MHKCGFVNIIGKPNVGKSTLMNAFLGEKLSIVTHKAQTTRHRIRGILNGENFQIVYSDTPGIIKPHYKLHEAMMKFVNEALEDADVILLVTEVNDKTITEEKFLTKLKKLQCPLLLLINKIDLGNQQLLEETVSQWKNVFPNAEIIPVCATKKFNTDYVLKRIIALLPEGPPYFPKEDKSDRPLRFFVSEFIREKIFMLFHEEIPYSTEVTIEEFKETENIVYIRAIIYVMRESQKAILIGKQGRALKKLGTIAREEIEQFLGKKVFLETLIKVETNWRDNEKRLRKFGYLE
jgi:GTP-binding protein Era